MRDFHLPDAPCFGPQTACAPTSHPLCGENPIDILVTRWQPRWTSAIGRGRVVGDLRTADDGDRRRLLCALFAAGSRVHALNGSAARRCAGRSSA